MKIRYTLLAMVAGSLLLTSCVREKEYSCDCTYVAISTGPNAGQPNKVEKTTLKGRVKSDVEVDCHQLQAKYAGQFYQGTCIVP